MKISAIEYHKTVAKVFLRGYFLGLKEHQKGGKKTCDIANKRYNKAVYKEVGMEQVR